MLILLILLIKTTPSFSYNSSNRTSTHAPTTAIFNISKPVFRYEPAAPIIPHFGQSA
jgi:hypothetical protein